MTDVLALSIQIGLLIALAAIFYAIFQIVRTDDDDSAK